MQINFREDEYLKLDLKSFMPLVEILIYEARLVLPQLRARQLRIKGVRLRL